MSEQANKPVQEKDHVQPESVGKRILGKVEDLVGDVLKRTGFDIPKHQVVGVDLTKVIDINTNEIYRGRITDITASGLIIEYRGLGSGGKDRGGLIYVSESGEKVMGSPEAPTETFLQTFLQDLDKLRGAEAKLTFKVPAEQ